MDFVSKDQLKISLARVKTWIENTLFGFVPRSEDPAGTLIADSDGLHDGPNDEYYYLPGSDGAMDANADADHTLATYGYVDASVQGALGSFNGNFGVQNITGNTTIESTNTKTILKITATSACTVTLPSPTMGRGFYIMHGFAESTSVPTYTINGGSVKIAKLGQYYQSQASTPTTLELNSRGKAVFVFAISGARWNYIELN